RNMIMVIGPTRKKAEAKAEQRRKREEDAAASNGRPVAVTGHTTTEAVVDTSVGDTSVVDPGIQAEVTAE
ncbi:MAG TPA: translation initiation factor IF-3, partial [Dermatophilaceae bacterium]|nr:translation initiation factor IF-3 [Dermatophilaceae bacterium]